MRGFSDDERTAIEEGLVESGRDLFTRHGFRRTRVEDLTDAVGIAESTFYRFFDSKAALYTRVLIREHEELVDAVEEALSGVDDPDEQVRRLVETWAREFEERPLLKTSHQAPRELLRELDRDAIETAKARFVERLSPVVEDLQARSDGAIAEMDTALVLELLSVVEQATAQADVHEQFGWSGYADFREALVTVLARGLTAADAPESVTHD